MTVSKLTKHKPNGTTKERVAPPAAVNTTAADAELAEALYKILPDADKWLTLETLSDGFAKHLPDRSPVMALGRSLELGFVEAHAYHGVRPGYFRPSSSYVPARLVGSVADRSPLLLNAEHIAAAAARLPKILDGLDEHDSRRRRVRIGIPAGAKVPTQIVVFVPDSRGRYQFLCLEK
jgi:hypothetical protein